MIGSTIRGTVRDINVCFAIILDPVENLVFIFEWVRVQVCSTIQSTSTRLHSYSRGRRNACLYCPFALPPSCIRHQACQSNKSLGIYRSLRSLPQAVSLIPLLYLGHFVPVIVRLVDFLFLFLLTMEPGSNHLQVPDPTTFRRGSDPGPSSSYCGLNTGNVTNISMGPTSLAGGSSFFPGNSGFSFSQLDAPQPPDPLGDFSSTAFATHPVLFQSYASTAVLDSLNHDLKLFEAELQESPGKYEVNELLQLQSTLMNISCKINSAINLRATNPIIDTSVAFHEQHQQHHHHHQQQPPRPPQPSTTTRSSASERFICKICEKLNKHIILGSRSTFARHIADAHGGRTKHLCHVPGCDVCRFRSDKIKDHRTMHARENPEFDSLLKPDHLAIQMPPPKQCAVCDRPVSTWDEWMRCLVAHCRCTDTTPSENTGRSDDDGDDDNYGDGNGGGGGGGGGSGYGYDGQRLADQAGMTAGLGSHFGVEGTNTFPTGGYNGYARECSKTAPCSPKAVPSDDGAPEIAKSDCNTLTDLREPPQIMIEKGNLNLDKSSSVNTNKSNDTLRQPPIPRKKLAQAVFKCCLPPCNNSATAYSPQDKDMLSSNSTALVRKSFPSRKSLIPVGDTRSPRLVFLEHAVPRAEHKRQPATMQSIRGVSKWQAGRRYCAF